MITEEGLIVFGSHSEGIQVCLCLILLIYVLIPSFIDNQPSWKKKIQLCLQFEVFLLSSIKFVDFRRYFITRVSEEHQAPAPHSTLIIWVPLKRNSEACKFCRIYLLWKISQRSDLPSSWPEQRRIHLETSLPWREEEERSLLPSSLSPPGEERVANVSSEDLRNSCQAVLTREELITPLQSLSQHL